EDGIRDFHVTGVQTCALPIYRFDFPLTLTPSIPTCRNGEGKYFVLIYYEWLRYHTGPLHPSSSKHYAGQVPASGMFPLFRGDSRSEERRVGKECRARWASGLS